MPIKEIIIKFPKIADILNEYNIGCVPCNVGTCLLKDIVEIHNLSLEQEEELLTKMAQIIYPGEVIKMPKIQRRPPVEAGQLKYSPAIKKLVDEHALIKRWVALIPNVIAGLDLRSEAGRQLILRGVDFIRSYADKFHHAKEEEILFKYFDENLDILKVMQQDHENARSHVRAILDAVEKRDETAVREHLRAYQELLNEHIQKEDEILYPWMDRNLTLNQIGELFSKFNDKDWQTGKEVQEGYERWVKNLEEKLNQEVVK